MEISGLVQHIEVLEKSLGKLCFMACNFEEFGFGWMVWPVDQSRVMVFDGYGFNWGPGWGPCRTLEECLCNLLRQLDACDAVAVGKPGPHGPDNPKPWTGK